MNDYSRWPTKTRFGSVSVDKLYKTYDNIDVTNLRLSDYESVSEYTNGAGQKSQVVRMSDGRKVTAHNIKTKINWGLKGVAGSIAWSGVIDGFSQAYGDWAAGLCLSSNQRFWRAFMAGLFGLGTGLLGTVATVLLVTAGAPAIIAALAGFAVGYTFSKVFYNTKNDYVDSAGNWAGRY